MAFILCGPCKGHSEKEVSWKNSEGKGNRARAVGTPVMVLLNKSSFRYTRFWYTLWMVYFDSSCQHSKVYYPTGNARWQRWDQQVEGLLSKKARSVRCFNCLLTIANFTTRNIHCPQLARALRNSRGWYLASLSSSHESEVKIFLKRQNIYLIKRG